MKNKKVLAAKLMGTSPGKVRFAGEALEDIRKAITRADLRGLIAVGKIFSDRSNYHSRARAREIKIQKRKGRQKGKGSHKGSKYSVASRKNQWISRIRVQREFLNRLRQGKLLGKNDYRRLYRMSKGGYFRNRRHIKLYLAEQNLTPAGSGTITEKRG